MGKTRETIRQIIEDSGSATASELANCLEITRQAVNAHLGELIRAGKIFKTGSKHILKKKEKVLSRRF